MIHELVIAGKKVAIEWTNDASRNMRIRSSKIGADIPKLWAGVSKENSAEYAVTAFIWMLLPSGTYSKYQSPEDLYSDLSVDDAKSNFNALIGVIADMEPSDEKKSTLTNSHLQGSNSE